MKLSQATYKVKMTATTIDTFVKRSVNISKSSRQPFVFSHWQASNNRAPEVCCVPPQVICKEVPRFLVYIFSTLVTSCCDAGVCVWGLGCQCPVSVPLHSIGLRVTCAWGSADGAQELWVSGREHGVSVDRKTCSSSVVSVWQTRLQVLPRSDTVGQTKS